MIDKTCAACGCCVLSLLIFISIICCCWCWSLFILVGNGQAAAKSKRWFIFVAPTYPPRDPMRRAEWTPGCYTHCSLDMFIDLSIQCVQWYEFLLPYCLVNYPFSTCIIKIVTYDNSMDAKRMMYPPPAGVDSGITNSPGDSGRRYQTSWNPQ